MNTTHTPTPWTSGFGSTREGSYADIYTLPSAAIRAQGVRSVAIAKCHVHADKSDLESQIANAAFIVRACNAHDDLVALAQRIEKLSSSPLQRDYVPAEIQQMARAALAKAGA